MVSISLKFLKGLEYPETPKVAALVNAVVELLEDVWNPDRQVLGDNEHYYPLLL